MIIIIVTRKKIESHKKNKYFLHYLSISIKQKNNNLKQDPLQFEYQIIKLHLIEEIVMLLQIKYLEPNYNLKIKQFHKLMQINKQHMKFLSSY
jgi:hypothetical protein